MKNVVKYLALPILSACLMGMLSGSAFGAEKSGTGYLKVKADPNHAGVFVDGKYVGPAANFGVTRKYAVEPGEHQIDLRDPRYQDFSTKVTIEAGKTTTIHQKLQPATIASPPFGNLRIQGGSSKFDGVFVNGKFMGHVDEFNNFAQGLLLNPGEYDLKVVSPNGTQELEQKITIEKDKTTRVHVGGAS